VGGAMMVVSALAAWFLLPNQEDKQHSGHDRVENIHLEEETSES